MLKTSHKEALLVRRWLRSASYLQWRQLGEKLFPNLPPLEALGRVGWLGIYAMRLNEGEWILWMEQGLPQSIPVTLKEYKELCMLEKTGKL